MPDSRPVIHLYARGWAHAGWYGRYYPDDLPAEWRLSYYANEFGGVLVPEADWREAGDAELEEWAEEVPAGFRFYLEADAPPESEAARRARHLGRRFAGWVVPERVAGEGGGGIESCRLLDAPTPAGACRLHPPAAGDLRGQRSLLEKLAEDAAAQPELALFVAGDPPPMEMMRSLRQLTELLGLA